jgi:F-type H+-transporting ATPase subunit gamma
VNRVALLVITADRGMCGGYNLEVCRRALEVWERSKRTGTTVRFVLRGRRGIGYFQRRQADIVHRETWRREGFSGPDVERLLGVLLELYRSGRVDAVDVVYTEFRSPIHRVPRVVRLLPIELPASELPAERVWRWYHEPGFAAVVEELLAIYLRVQLCDVLLESYASEQGARMITMQEASERAGKTLQEYRVLHHRLRREAITVDLLQTLFASRAARGGGASAVPAGPA